MSEYLYLDIETLPTNDPAIIADIAATIKPPGSMKKAETIEAWERDCKADAVKEAVAKTAFSGAFGRVAVIGWAVEKATPTAVWQDDHASEADVIEGWFDELSQNIRMHRTIVGHHVAGFDLRFIRQRCMVLGIRLPPWFPHDPKPWGDDVHDTMTMWAGVRDTISLDNLCKALRVPGKTDMTGADVADAWERGEAERVIAYCIEDVNRVRACHLQMIKAIGG